MYAYKKLTAQDIAVVPFNAHKQYDFDSASCSSNKIDHYNTQWTSESISLYTSTSAVYGGDVKNVLKYQQLDHLFYREFPHNHSNTLGSFNYLKQKRNLYEKANILSIPTGLYGYEIKPGSFYVKTADGTEVVDDSYGNLLISGTFTSSDYPVDVRGNVFRLDPIKGFKDYDLGVYKDYALKWIDPQHPEAGIKKVFYKRGDIKANSPTTYSTPDGNFEIDNSYFYNPFKYNRINFSPITDSEIIKNSSFTNGTQYWGHAPSYSWHSLGKIKSDAVTYAHLYQTGTGFQANKTYRVKFTIKSHVTGLLTVYLISGTPGDAVQNIGSVTIFGMTNGTYERDITIGQQSNAGSWWLGQDNSIRFSNQQPGVTHNFFIDDVSVKEIKPHKIPTLSFSSITGSNIVSEHNERYNFNRDDDFAISFYIKPRVLEDSIPNNITVGQYLQGGTVYKYEGGIAYIVRTKALTGFYGASQFWGPNTGTVNGLSSTTVGEGETFTQNMAAADTTGIGLANHVMNSTIAGYSDWWIPSIKECQEFMALSGGVGLQNFTWNPPSPQTLYQLFFINNGITPIFGPNSISPPGSTPSEFNLLTSNDDGSNFVAFDGGTMHPSFATFTATHQKTTALQNGIVAGGAPRYMVFPVRKVDLTVFDTSRRYIVAKSTTRSVIPTAMQGTSEVLNMNSVGGLTETGSNMQPKGIPAQPQFPYEIYMTSQSIHFARSDGETTFSLSCDITGSEGSAEKLTHILCQTSASNMELYFDGILKESSSISSILKPHTQNKANLYIGSKGEESKTDGFDPDYIHKYFHGDLTSLNIYREAFNQTEVKNISESLNGSPYIGNIFYQNGFATITHPKYYHLLSGSDGDGTIDKLKFQGTHLMYEHEYQCTVDEHEFNQSFNLSTREIQSNNNYNLAGFTTSSYFKPYVTTVGLYNEAGDCLVVGKLGQPVRMSNETDTTFVLRWDT
jgi:hypothetical protein